MGSLFAWLKSDTRAALSLGFLLLLVMVSIAAPWIAPYSPIVQDANLSLAEPDAAHLLGTDDLGRDVLSRLIHGAPATLYASFLAVSIATLIGVPVGLLAGFRGGWIDNGMIAVGIVFSPQIARLVRARALVVRQELYVDAARCLGASNARILWKHVLPNAIQPVIVQVTLLLAGALLAEASLSFLGLGIQPPNPSWGSMLARAYQNMEIAPAQMYPPGLAILLTALAFNTLGESLRVALDPTMKR
jgi:peptide/nickel transport system permease protein